MLGIKIWLDDLRHPPKGWICVRTANAAIVLMKYNKTLEISLDHDLGWNPACGNGYDVLLWIEEQVRLNGYEPPIIHVHTDNPSARPKMLAAIKSIHNFLSEPD